MTYNVFGGTLNLAQSILYSTEFIHCSSSFSIIYSDITSLINRINPYPGFVQQATARPSCASIAVHFNYGQLVTGAFVAS